MPSMTHESDVVSRHRAAGRRFEAAGVRSFVLDQGTGEPVVCMHGVVHPWDIDGAKRAGLRAGWINRGGTVYPPYFQRPDVEAQNLPDLADALTDGGRAGR